MITVIYADLLFIINMLGDIMILYLTAYFASLGRPFLRILVASAVGGIIGALADCAEIVGITRLFLLFPNSLLLCFIVFGRKRLRSFFRIVFYFYFSSILLYGGTSAVFYLFSMLRNTQIPAAGFFVTLIIIGIAFFMLILSLKLSSRGIKSNNSSVTVEINDGVRVFKLNLYCDSGSFAKDPFSGMPVTVVGKDSLDPRLYKALSEKLYGDEENSPYSHIKPRVIPIKTVSGTTLLYAFIPESIHICDSKGKHPIESIIAIDTHQNAFFGKDGVIPSELVDMI